MKCVVKPAVLDVLSMCFWLSQQSFIPFGLHNVPTCANYVKLRSAPDHDVWLGLPGGSCCTRDPDRRLLQAGSRSVHITVLCLAQRGLKTTEGSNKWRNRRNRKERKGTERNIEKPQAKQTASSLPNPWKKKGTTKAKSSDSVVLSSLEVGLRLNPLAAWIIVAALACRENY